MKVPPLDMSDISDSYMWQFILDICVLYVILNRGLFYVHLEYLLCGCTLDPSD